MLAELDWMAGIGRLHPLILHLPVGLLVALGGVELMRRSRRQAEPDAARGVLVLLLAIFTPLAALTGWLLHESDDYGDPVELHEWLGIALMACSLALAVAHRRRSPRFGAWLLLGLVLLVPTAHFGATLTHGADYLFEPWRVAAPTTQTTVDAAHPFAAVEPFFAAYCTKCHGASKQKGGLALHDYEALMAGGDDGPAFIAGDPAASALIDRLRLPLDDDDHMPPAEKRQPTADEVDALAAWIATFGEEQDEALARRLSAASVTHDLLGDDPAPRAEAPHDAEAVRVAIAELRARFVFVAPLSAESDSLSVDFGAARLVPGELEARLAPLRALIADLDLSTHALTSTDLEFVAELPRLERLDLRRLQVDALDLAPLARCERLATLNLAGTTLAPGSIEVLAALPALRSVFVHRTGLDDAQLARLGDVRPELEVRGASPPPDSPLEVEPKVRFERPADESAELDELRPTNETCPITGKPVDARYTIIADGRPLGFCCAACPATYWAQRDVQREER